jgi:hypothetical protein
MGGLLAYSLLCRYRLVDIKLRAMRSSLEKVIFINDLERRVRNIRQKSRIKTATRGS